MLFENLSQQGAGEKKEEVLGFEGEERELLCLFRSKVEEKNIQPEIRAFFKEKDEESLDMFEKHPDTDVKSVLLKSRIAMHQVRKNVKKIDRKPRFYHPKVS